ncbi:hypothetical protein I7I53_07762 [Histoplasma capsulatum var. duboisii H88]|uniref:Uncharacterized protein n=1 Tax=Ajellomyces capsulatus (strain H88) TaxID=544711 RepID=A0A8A1LF88_AJEC8|nr:hypothetical protein I7I53_07762 [Histoplasma capsulatum var. duboisii H88]
MNMQLSHSNLVFSVLVLSLCSCQGCYPALEHTNTIGVMLLPVLFFDSGSHSGRWISESACNDC